MRDSDKGMKILCACALFLLSAIASAQVVLPDWEEVRIKTHDLGGGVFMLEGFGGNIGALIGADGILLVDDQYAPLNEKILSALAVLSDRDVQFVINTHWHPDHSNGNQEMAERGAVILAHDNTRRHLAEAQSMEALGELLRPTQGALPILSFNDTVHFHFNNETVRVLHIGPAHTDGDAIVQFMQADVIHVGDAYFNGFYPYIDIESGGAIDGMIGFLDELSHIAGPATQIIPGHGPIADRMDVLRYRDDLRIIRARVKNAIAEGVTLEELIAQSPLADLNPVYAGDIVGEADVLGMVYRSLQKDEDGK